MVGHGAWVGASVFVGPGVVIGMESVVTAGSVVLKSLPAEMVCSGNPAAPRSPRWKPSFKGVPTFLIKAMSVLGLVCVLVAVFWCALTKSPVMFEVCWMPAWLGRWADDYPIFRNFPAFALLSFTASVSLASFDRIRRTINFLALAIISWIAISLFGVGLEFAQLWIPSRSFDLLDIGWTLAGAFTGALLALALLTFAFSKMGDD